MRVLFIPGAKVVRLPANPVEATEQSLQIFRDRFGAEVEFVFNNTVSVDEVACPKTAFVRVLDNLLINAIHACRARPDSRVSVDFELSHQAGKLMISVSDNGVGIPESVKARLFEPYFTTREEGEGTGLGLAIVRKITRDYGGELDFESVEGQGTTFRFTVPVRN
jgi:signal transduction histidine kinase